MLNAYLTYFDNLAPTLQATFVVAANNCSDKTVPICKQIKKKHPNLEVLNMKPGGKGFALKQGYLHALKKPYDMIGFVDADMATKPKHFHELISAAQNCDGAIASRYIKGANVWPKRSAFRVVTGKIYNWVLRKQFNFSYRDTQCGAKIFSYQTMKSITPQLQETGWACDLEFLYLCQVEKRNIKEIPTTWSDQPGSHLEISGNLIKDMLPSPTRIKKNHKDKVAVHKKPKHHYRRKK